MSTVPNAMPELLTLPRETIEQLIQVADGRGRELIDAQRRVEQMAQQNQAFQQRSEALLQQDQTSQQRIQTLQADRTRCLQIIDQQSATLKRFCIWGGGLSGGLITGVVTAAAAALTITCPPLALITAGTIGTITGGAVGARLGYAAHNLANQELQREINPIKTRNAASALPEHQPIPQ